MHSRIYLCLFVVSFPCQTRYLTVPQEEACRECTDRQSRWPRGKVLGGTGSINFLVHAIGCRGDYDAWETEHGAYGWGWEDVLPFFKRSEKRIHSGARHTYTSKNRGTSGPLIVADPAEPNPWTLK